MTTKKFLVGLGLLACMSLTAAQAQTTKGQAQSIITSTLPTNNARAITALKIRQVMFRMLDYSSGLDSLTRIALNGYASLSGSYANPSWITSLPTSKITGLDASLSSKQNALVSGSTIKTVNGISLLGSGDLVISGGGGGGSSAWGSITGTLSSQTDLQNALNLKANLASPTFTGTVSGITKSMVGLGSVDNTSDAGKPISTATQTALDGKASLTGSYANPSWITSLPFTKITGTATTAQIGTGTPGAGKYVDGATGAWTTLPAGGGGGTWGSITGTLSSQTDLQTALNAKQATLVSGTTLKTIGGVSLLGSGDIPNGGGGVAWGGISGTLSSQTDLQAALNLKANLASPTFTGTVSGITKAMVGLTNVDNTSDASKPVSTATQTALNDKASLTGSYANPSWITSLPFTKLTGVATVAQIGTGTAGAGKYVDGGTGAWTTIPTGGAVTWGTITGSLSSQTDLQAALNLKANLASPTFTGTVSGITKAMVGLGNVDNTSDASKLISTATQAALDGKQATLVSATNIKTVNGTSLLGSGDLVISGGGGGDDAYLANNQTFTGTNTFTGLVNINPTGNVVHLKSALWASRYGTTTYYHAGASIFTDAGGGTVRFQLLNTGNMVFGAGSDNGERLQVPGNMESTTAGSGLILKTPDGTKRYRITIDNSGNLITTLL